MKKKNVLNLIKYHSESNESAFREEAYEIARYFDNIGDYQLAQYIMGLMSDANVFVPQLFDSETPYFKKLSNSSSKLPLPEPISDDILGIINAIKYRTGVNKFLFEGDPGTGKTESAKQISRILNRELFLIETDQVVDSKLGQTAKNISKLFDEINSFKQPQNVIILMDEIDSIAIDRINSNDLREMGRATSAVLKGMDNLSEKIIFLATTNLFHSFDKALVRRFDATINFNRYSRSDLLDISNIIFDELAIKYKVKGKNKRLFTKIIDLFETIPYPGELKNLIKSAIVFSDISVEFEYLKRLYNNVIKDVNFTDELRFLSDNAFTVREIEIITSVSKSHVARKLKEL